MQIMQEVVLPGVDLRIHSPLLETPEIENGFWEEVVSAFSLYYEAVSKQPLNLPTAYYLWRNVLPHIQSVADLGTGFSSALIAIYSKRIRKLDILSVDDNTQWLERNKQFLRQLNLDNNNLHHIKTLRWPPATQFDLVIHDLGNTALKRLVTLTTAYDMTRKYLLVDDTNYPFYRYPLAALARSDRIEVIGKNESFRKYSSLLIKRS